MSKLDNKLVSVPPENMDVDSLIGWFSTQFSTSAEIFKEAEQYYSDMKKHHQHMSELMGMLQDLRNEGNTDKEDIDDIVETASEVVQAIQYLRDGTASLKENSLSIAEVEADYVATDRGKAALDETENELKIFMKNYNALKAKLNLKTQKDVANLTGIDRRYISIIEQGKHKPQFKTLKRLADAFGVEIEELTS